MERGFYVGRFHPFHCGHMNVIEAIDDEVDELVVAVGSAQESHTVENPFTAGERIEMIAKSLESIAATHYVIPIEDLNRNAVWVAHIESMCPPFDTVYSNNPLVTRLFEERGFEVKGTPMFDRDRYNGAAIRRRMREREDWRHLVPDAVVEAVEEVDGEQRVRQVDKSDYPGQNGG